MPKFNTIDDLEVRGKRVLVRADLNTPMKDGAVIDTTRIERSLTTILELADARAQVIVMSHFGRPKGEVVPEMSLKPVAEALGHAAGHGIAFAPDCIGEEAERVAAAVSDGDIVVLENLRFHAEEEANDHDFAGKLAELGHLYVNDAFSCAHRAHASTTAIAALLPTAAGRLMQAELRALEGALETPEHPVGAVVGGAKVSTKIDLLQNLVEKVDALVIGGGMANTFLAARGVDVGKSLCEHDLADTARAIDAAAKKAGCEIVLPVDGVVAKKFEAGAENEVVDVDAIPSDSMMLDVGPKTVEAVKAWITKADTLVWNGPLGAFEIEPFDKATVEAARHAAARTREGLLVSVAGGGDTVSALNHAGVAQDFTYVSTAGGAFLEWMEGKELPGVKALGA